MCTKKERKAKNRKKTRERKDEVNRDSKERKEEQTAAIAKMSSSGGEREAATRGSAVQLSIVETEKKVLSVARL